MYEVKFKDLNEAARIMYCFMVNPDLTRPECTILKDAYHEPITLTNTGNGFMSEEDFCNLIVLSNHESIICVASTDKTDNRRVVLGMMAGMNHLKLNFPQSNGKPNAAERRIVRSLNNA